MASAFLKTLIVVGLVCVSLANAFPADKKDSSSKKSTQNRKCNTVCPDDFKPICAGDGTNKPLSFGNPCVLEAYNCEHGTTWKIQKDGECPNSGGIRLA